MWKQWEWRNKLFVCAAWVVKHFESPKVLYKFPIIIIMLHADLKSYIS